MDCCCSSANMSSSVFSTFQVYSSPYGKRYFNKSLHPGQLAKPFLQLNDSQLPINHHRATPFLCKRLYKGRIYAESKREAWDLGRFIKTLYFFNGPPSPEKILEALFAKLPGLASSEPEKEKPRQPSGVVLVAGGTGGVGKRVVDILRKKGFPVRVLVRNEEKARRLLGLDVDLIVGDITKESTLDPEKFKGVRNIVNAVSVIVGPKEGDTPDRAKYSQV
ncbi:unnamed protein product [Rhodiola kirilowii]